MFVIMNDKGKYASIGQKETHTGYHQTLAWSVLNSATLFSRINERDYKAVYRELSAGIQIEAEVSRIVTLVTSTVHNIPSGAEYYHNSTHYKKGNVYALYFKNGWRESATLTNEMLIEKGVPINVNGLLSRED